MTNYIMPTSMDLPPIRVVFEEVPYPYGPSGAKGIGELPMDGPAPQSSTRSPTPPAPIRLNCPLTPERLMDLMEISVVVNRTVRMTCVVNGRRLAFDTHPMARLLDVLRLEARLTGTKEGCGEGECGACAVLLNVDLVNSCLTPAAHADGGIITTIEGVASTNDLHVVQDAFLECGGAQCGICTPGMVLAAVDFLSQGSRAD